MPTTPEDSEVIARLTAGLKDRYTIERELGGGGMALVFAAHDMRHDRQVAIKVLRPEVASAIGAERFLQEIRICAKLFHPHILTIFDSGEIDGLLYYVMPLLKGESLRDQLTRQGTLPVYSALRIAHECCDALAFAHSNGVVHRDIKPENILFEADHAIVADFGIARALGASGGERLTTLGLVLGTPAYMSPEQAAGESRVDARSDIYSLGLIVFEMCAGRPAFTGTPTEVMAKQVTEKPPSLSTVNSGTPARVAAAVEKALAKNPDDRFQSAQEFAAALGARRTDDQPKDRSMRGLLAIGAGILAISWAVYASTHRDDTSGTRALGSVASGLNRKLEQVTFAEGVEEWPALSPDGQFIAFAAEENGHRRIVVRSRQTGEDRRITSGATDEIQPAWSGDGKSLAFVKARTAARLEPTDVNGIYDENADIWVVDVASTKERRLVENAFNPAFSPDGKQLAFDAAWAGAQRLWIADREGKNPRQVSTDSSEAVVHGEPSWSPDSRKIAFRRSEKTISDIAILDITSQKITAVTLDNVLDMNPAWAPDGTIYFSSNGGGGLNIWRAKVNSSDERDGPLEQITTGAGDDINPSVAANGDVVFSLRAFDSDIWRLPVDPSTGKQTGAPVPVIKTTRVESRGSWSPDGRMIAFNSDRRGEMNIWLKTLDTGGERQLTTGTGGDYQATWAPDGKSVVFFSARAGNTDIWSADVASGKLTQITNDRAMDTNPFYSPDGKLLAFMSDRRGRLEVWVMQPDGKGQRPVSDIRAGGHFIRWTDDSRFVLFRAESGTVFQTVKVSVADGSAEKLRDVSSGAHMSWSPSRTVIMDVKGHKTLYAYPLVGTPMKVFEFPESEVRIDYPVWSPDGKSVLFDRAPWRGADIWIVHSPTAPRN